MRYEGAVHAIMMLREWWANACPELYMIRAMCLRNAQHSVNAITSINYWLNYIVAQMPWRFSRL